MEHKYPNEVTVYKNWILSLGPEMQIDDKFNLVEEAKNLLLLRVFEVLRPGIIDWKAIEKIPVDYLNKLSNLNFLFVAMKISNIVMPGIKPSDILDSEAQVIYPLLWNFMQIYFIERVVVSQGYTEEAIVEWALKFKQIDAKFNVCRLDEIVGAEDREFFYNDLINGNRNSTFDFSFAPNISNSISVAVFENNIDEFAKFNDPKLDYSIKKSFICGLVKFKEGDSPKFQFSDLLSNEEIEDQVRNKLTPIPVIKETPISLQKKFDRQYVHPFATAVKKSIPSNKNQKQEEKSANPIEIESMVLEILENSFHFKNKIELDAERQQKIEKLKLLSKKIDQFMELDFSDDQKSEFLDSDIRNLISHKKEKTSKISPDKRVSELLITDGYKKAKELALKSLLKNQEVKVYPYGFQFTKKYKRELYKTIKSKFENGTNDLEVRSTVLQKFPF